MRYQVSVPLTTVTKDIAKIFSQIKNIKTKKNVCSLDQPNLAIRSKLDFSIAPVAFVSGVCVVADIATVATVAPLTTPVTRGLDFKSSAIDRVYVAGLLVPLSCALAQCRH